MSVIEKWIRKDVNMNKLSTSQVAASDDIKDMPKIQVNNLTGVNSGFTAVHCGVTSTYIYLQYEEGTDLNSVPFYVKGSLEIYRWNGTKDELESNLTDPTFAISGHVDAKCGCNESFLSQCEHIHDVYIEMFGLAYSEGCYIVYDHNVAEVCPEVIDRNTQGPFVAIKITSSISLGLERISDASASPPYFFVGKSHLAFAPFVQSMSINGDYLPSLVNLIAADQETCPISMYNVLYPVPYEVPRN